MLLSCSLMFLSCPFPHSQAFLYAIANGAEYIFDFDDDNELLNKVDLFELTTAKAGAAGGVKVRVPETKCSAFNPYESFEATASGMWARGVPLDDINTCRAERYCEATLNEPDVTVGVYQSLANHDPDVDAIWRLTREIPVDFKPNPQVPPLAIPTGAFSPFNAQATIFHRSAFWGLFLPTTVHSRVSDIWRSYFDQALFRHSGIALVFVDPLVVQHRNAHSYLADFDSEKPLYERAGELVRYLSQWEPPRAAASSANAFAGAYEKLYIDLYEHGIIELEDVQLAQEWMLTLQGMGYKFPELKEKATTLIGCNKNQKVN